MGHCQGHCGFKKKKKVFLFFKATVTLTVTHLKGSFFIGKTNKNDTSPYLLRVTATIPHETGSEAPHGKIQGGEQLMQRETRNEEKSRMPQNRPQWATIVAQLLRSPEDISRSGLCKSWFPTAGLVIHIYCGQHFCMLWC